MLSYLPPELNVMLQELVNKRNEILDSLKTMYTDLESVNKQIDSEIVENNKTIAALTAEVNSLNNLRQSNNCSIKNLRKIIGE